MASRIRVQDAATAQFRALWHLLGWPLLAFIPIVAAAFFYCLPGIDRLADMFTSPADIAGYRQRAVVILCGATFFLFFDSVALTWAGMLCAFKVSRPRPARSWTGFLVLALPNVLFLALVVLVLNSFRSYAEFYPLALLWAAVKTCNDLILIFYARRWLFREAHPSLLRPPENLREGAFWPSRSEVQAFLTSNLRLLRSPETHCAVQPPSITISVPVRNPASGEQT
jgi:hypothetical protein